MDKDKECWVSPEGDIFTRKGVYGLNDSNDLILKERKSFGIFAELERDLAQTLGLERSGNIEEALMQKGFIYYWENLSKWMIPYHKFMTPFNVPTKAQIAAALAQFGDNIGDGEDI